MSHLPPQPNEFDEVSVTAVRRQLTAEQPPALRLVAYPAEGPAFQLVIDSAARFGRGGSGVVALRDTRVSRAHFEVTRREPRGAFEVRDLRSTNGTAVNGQPVLVKRLTDGDVIRAGDSVFVAEFGTHVAAEGGVPLEQSARLAIVLEELSLAANHERSVLLLGETGVGKTHFAKFLHEASRPGRPFQHINCAELPTSLIESELFGHTRGAFTGAATEKVGIIESAHRGTLFLDEIGTLSLDLQAKLLRVIEERTVRRVGSSQASARLDIRFVAATNLDIDEAIDARTFREDLFARFGQGTVVIPPLRERRADILPLLCRFARRPDHTAFSAEVKEALLSWPWDHNVRELQHLGEILAARSGEKLDYHTLPRSMQNWVRNQLVGAPDPTVVPSREQLEVALERRGGVKARVAADFGVSRALLYKWLEERGLR